MKSIQLQTIIFILFFLLANNSYSQLIISANMTAAQMVNEIVGSDITFTNAILNGGNNASGTFMTGGTPTNLGMASGIILSTGSVLDAPGPNLSGSTSTSNGTGSDPQLAALIPGYTINDACYLQFDFVPQGDTVRLRYVFGSEEYPEWVGSSFNDVFGLFITGINPDSGTYNNVNIAIIPNTTLPVTIDNVNSSSYSQYYVDNTSGTTIQYDGFTTVLTAWCKVTPGTQYSIKIAVGDAGDSAYDSAIILETGSFNCGSSTPSAYNNGPLCTGSTLNLTGQSETTGCTYFWTGPNAFSSTLQNPFIPNVTMAMAGDYYLQTISGTDTSIAVLTTVVINLVPTSTFTASADSVCVNETTTLNYTGTASSTATYYWDLDGGFPDTITGPGPHDISWGGSGLVNVSLHVTENGCSSPPTYMSVYIKPTPVAEAGNSQTISGGATVSLNGSATGGSGNYSYSWSPATLLQDANIQNPTTIALNNSTVFTLHVTDNVTGCIVTDEVQVFVTGGVLSVAASANPSAVCPGAQTTLQAIPTGGTGIYSYSWTSNPAGYTSTVQSPVAYPTVTTQYIVQITSGIETASASATVQINSTPDAPGVIAGPTSVCKGSTNNSYVVPSVPNATSYTWILPNGASIVSGQGTNSIIVNFSSVAISGGITVMGANACGTGQASSLTVTVHSNPVANAGINQTVTSGSTITFNGSASGGSGDYSYFWSPVNLFQNASLQNPTTIAMTSSAIITLVIVDNITGCSGSANVQVIVTGGPLSVVANVSTATICQGDQITLQSLPTGGSGSYTYSWTSNPAGFTSSLQNTTDLPTISTQYIVSVNDGSQTVSASVSVSVNGIPDAAGNITGPSTVSQGASGINYSVPVINNATNYIWVLPQGVNIVSGQNTHAITVNFSAGASSGVITVYGSNSCGDGAVSQDFPVTVLTGIDEVSGFGFNLFPNPTNGIVMVEMSSYPNEKLTMKVYNIVGELLFETPLNNELRQSFRFSNFANGLYYVNIQGNKFNKIEKLIIQK